MELLGDVEDNEHPELTNKLGHTGHTSIIQKLTQDLIKELWHHVITTKCPHCKKNSPSVRKDGFTKIFVKPLQGRTKQAADQRKRLEASESQTVASTTHGKSSRKTSGANEEIDEEEEEEE